jgi:hypothetical protein
VKLCVWLFLFGLVVASSVHAQDTAAPPPSTSADTAEPAKPRGAPQVGIAPGTPQTGSLIAVTPAEEAELFGGTEAPKTGEWRFDFKGFLRAPMRLGFGSGDMASPDAGQGGKIHAPGQFPDGVFTDWRYTNNLPGPWAELRFLYGNGRVTANTSIAAYNFTDGGYRNLPSQLGIDQGFLNFDYSDILPRGKGGFVWNVGVFQNRYGAAGRYDAGKYETYLFGRTHVAGETITGFYHFSDFFTLTLEHGIGAKLEVFPRYAGVADPGPTPYPGPVQQGAQLVHHGHVMASIGPNLSIGAHYITTWTADARAMSEKDGRITTMGLDAKLSDSRFGDAYLGYSHLDSKNPIRVGEGLEILHSIAGWNLRDNYFGNASTGSGQIDTVLFQYSLSIAKYLLYPEPFWGQGPDIVVSLFGMYNHVSSDDPMFTGATSKLKWGAEATYTPLDFLGISMRFDRVQPDLDDSTVAFSQISPRIVLRSAFVTHEQVLIQYTRYFYGDHVTGAYPWGSLPPDKDAFMISAIMWW